MPKLEAVDLFYVSMPVVEDISDGSQDALLFRVAGGGKVGWVASGPMRGDSHLWRGDG